MTELEKALEQLDPATRSKVVATLNAGSVMQNLLADPEASANIHTLADRVAKKVNPAHRTADEIAAPFVEKVLKQVDERLAARDKKTEEESAVSRLQEQIESAKRDHSFTDEGISKILQSMKDKGIGDFETAMKAYRFDNPAPGSTPATPSQSMYWNVEGSMNAGDAKSFFFPDDGPKISDNPEAWEKETAFKYLNGQVALPSA